MENDKVTRLYEVDNATFDHDPSVPCIIGTVSGYMMSNEFRVYMEKGLVLIEEKMKEHGKLGWLADTRNADAFNPEDMEWTVGYWNPAAYKAGIKYCAFVMPESAFAEMSVEEYSEKTQEAKTIVVSHFKDIDAAKDWLREVLNR